MNGPPAPMNWAGNVTFSTGVTAPRTIDELCELVRAAAAGGRHVNVVGTGHSFSPIADTDPAGLLVSTEHLRRIGPIDEAAATVTIESGVRFAELGAWLHQRGWALANLPSLPHITVAGSAATGTHGSGVGNPALATAVSAIELVGADGELRRLDRNDDRLGGAVVALGALGVVARLDVGVQPSFDVTQRVWVGASFDAVSERFDELMRSAYSVSVFTDWHREATTQIWAKSMVGDGIGDGSPSIDMTGLGTPATTDVHPLGGDPSACTTQLGAPGPSHERLTHFRPDFVPSAGAELQSEYFIDRRDAVDAIAALRGIEDRLAPVLLISEIRTVAADDLWLSMAFGRDSVAFHFTWRLDPAGVAEVLPLVESALGPFAPRPHWGKLTALDSETIRQRYERIDDFDALRAELDPSGTFINRGAHALLG